MHYVTFWRRTGANVTPIAAKGLSGLLRPLGVLAVSLLLMALLVSCSDAGASPQAADFNLTLFDGSEFSLSEQRGEKAVVVNFWYPSCPPCRSEMPDLEQAWQELQGEDVRFVGVFVPQGFDTEQDARNLVSELELTYDFGTDAGGKVSSAYQLVGFPSTYFIDKTGNVFRSHVGALKKEQVTRTVREMQGG